MDVLKFTLSGKTAFFKKPDVNTYYYFTYGNIHKVALLGIFGAINGYMGYNQQNHDYEDYPEFYAKFKDIKIGIVPQNYQGYISKKIQIFNNSVGYASEEKGGNLIVKEQWLEYPRWDIYFQINNDVEYELSHRLKNSNFIYVPYLGKNDHIANITDIELIKNIDIVSQVEKIDSLYIKKYFDMLDNDDDIFEDNYNYIPIFKYEEKLPIALEEVTNNYILETFVFTNSKIKDKYKEKPLVYNCNGKSIFFY